MFPLFLDSENLLIKESRTYFFFPNHYFFEAYTNCT